MEIFGYFWKGNSAVEKKMNFCPIFYLFSRVFIITQIHGLVGYVIDLITYRFIKTSLLAFVVFFPGHSLKAIHRNSSFMSCEDKVLV